ncbi:type VII secretion protein EccB [Cellulomonas palmilytica]|uniref:type VII secretion protein EccB n=1 Tax=Cellulomonas palmilytica TaxID=2608402 RepID=UPI001F3D4258|nr:type VII secretion protein EccB [Cellulomonas palmilytica]UJP39871.1 type VII secretion protein EccB [Cellulomonas palmilytica]
MAAKRDLVEAQSFSRRRLLTAFVSGAPGGQELEPTKPMRGVVAGVSLAVLVVLGSLAWGAIRSDPKGWESNKLVVVKGEGTRYVSLAGVLHPVVNTTSARLAVESGQFGVVELAPGVIADTERGETIGIVGAPDTPPSVSSLVADGWTACVAGTEVAASVGVELPTESGGALVARSAGETFVVAGGLRHRVPSDESAVLRAVGLDTVAPVDVPATWLNLVPEGSDLQLLTMDGAGDPLPAGSALGDLTVGTLIRVAGTGTADRWYVVDDEGEVAPLTPFAVSLYQARTEAVTLTLADVGAAQTADALAPADWPEQPVTAVPADAAPCVVLTPGDEGTVELVSTTQELRPGVHVAPGGGALVLSRTGGGKGVHALIDETGRRFGLSSVDQGDDDVLTRLGYDREHVTVVPPAWVDLFEPGPDLTVDAARTPVTS